MRLREWRELLKRMAGPGTYPHQLAFLLDNPARNLQLSPRQLIERVGLREHWRVLELGPGPGFFSRAFAQGLARGRLELFDLQREMLVKARRKLGRAKLANAGFAQGDARSLPYREASFDAAFLVAVLGEVPEPAACLRELWRVLQPGGRLSVSELPGDPDYTPFDELCALAASAGFELEERLGRGRSFTANFRRPEESEPRLRVEEHPDPEDVRFLDERINEFNFERTGIRDGRELALFVRERDGRIRAGLYGWTWGDTCEVRYLWVREDLRGRGLGAALLTRAEREARRRGAAQIVLGTHSFQAPGFYLKLGYQIVGSHSDYPRGHQQHFLCKPLAPD